MRYADLSGMVFGRLTAVKKTNKRGADGSIVWECLCSCGNTVYISSTNLKSGNTRSCGCYRSELKETKKGNRYRLQDGYYIGETSNTHTEFLIDVDDYDSVSQYTWREDKHGYIVTDVGNVRSVRMHRLITGTKSPVIDHKNGNTRDNRRCNLREATVSQNQMNRREGSNSLTGFRGVTYRKERDTYFARIRLNGMQKYLGTFKTKEEAVSARIKAENELFGEFSYTNSRGGDDQ